MVMALNTCGEDRLFDVRIAGEVVNVWNGKYQNGKLKIRKNDGCIFEIK